jgi:hypothetical protein
MVTGAMVTAIAAIGAGWSMALAICRISILRTTIMASISGAMGMVSVTASATGSDMAGITVTTEGRKGEHRRCRQPGRTPEDSAVPLRQGPAPRRLLVKRRRGGSAGYAPQQGWKERTYAQPELDRTFYRDHPHAEDSIEKNATVDWLDEL